MNYYKKILSLGLPVTFLLSTIISIVYVFAVKEVAYLNSSFSADIGGFIMDALGAFMYAIEVSGGLIVVIFFCSIIHFLLVETAMIMRMFARRDIGQHSFFKTTFLFLMTQVISVASIFVSIVLLYAATFGIVSVYGYVDLKMDVQTSLEGTINDNEKIIEAIKVSTSTMDVYDSAGELGVVLATRNLKRKEELTIYEGVVLPLVAKFSGASDQSSNFYVPSTNSVVYTNFVKDKTDSVIIQLVYNHLKHNVSSLVSSAFMQGTVPSVKYLDDTEYVPYLNKKQEEVDARYMKDFQSTIQDNEKVVAECKSVNAANTKLVVEQEADYRNNCVLAENYSDCSEFKKTIEDNKNISREAVDQCQENIVDLTFQYAELETMKTEMQQKGSNVLEGQKNELSNGMYFPDIQSVYIRVVPDQDSFIYLSTLLHELLHHYSNGGYDLPVFLNEGITEYLTFKSFDLSDYEIARNGGYFKESQIVMALLERIPEDELMVTYFKNDANSLEKVFKEYFPDVNYKDFLAKGDLLYKETYDAVENNRNDGFLDVEPDYPPVREMRTLLGLEERKFTE